MCKRNKVQKSTTHCGILWETLLARNYSAESDVGFENLINSVASLDI